ncbi:hypothetical protein L1D15_05980 [Vibrio sp. Isolate25]|uniref:hypothetical protein n=1 Tax=Vibrio sp. Isolate25 TaxID=2908535 RepID=UPI001EFE354E|nr:hypothetical protein [Vibrio sp. Isolate25]MCG9596274.1 hypothetical protein [Vibrio sp. Isolate25]
MRIWIGLWLALISIDVAAEQQSEKDSAFIDVNVTLELEGIEKSIDQTRASLDNIAGALDGIAHSDNLTEQQKQTLSETISNLNQLVSISRESVASFPAAIQHSQQVVSEKSQRFFDDLQLKIVLIVALVGVILIAIIGAVYWLLLRPLQNTVFSATHNVSQMAKALKVTAEAVERCSKRQEEITQQLAELSEKEEAQERR